MGIIGYDGRLRPAGRAVQAGMPNEFNPEQIGRIKEAQPKFIAEFTKLLDIAGGNAVRYGEALGRKAKEERELTARERLMTQREKLSVKQREIMEDDKLTPDEKRKAADELKVSVDKTGDDVLDRRIGLDARSMKLSAVNAIYANAEALERTVENTKFGAFTALEEAEVSANFDAELPKILSEVKSLDEIPVKVGSIVDAHFKDKEKNGWSGRMKPEYDKFVAGLKADFILKVAQGFTKKRIDDAKTGVITNVAGFVDGANNVGEVLIGVRKVLNTDDAKVLFTDAQRRETLNGAVITFSKNHTNETLRGIATKSDEDLHVASAYLYDGDVEKYNEAVLKINGESEKVHEDLITRLEGEKKDLLGDIYNDSNLSEPQKKAYSSVVTKDYDKLILDVKKKHASEFTRLKTSSKNTKTKVGKNAMTALKESVRNGVAPSGENVPYVATEVYTLIFLAEDFIDEKGNKLSYNEGTKKSFLRQNYGDAGNASELAVLDFKARIARLDMNKENNGNAFALRDILVNAANVFGKDSQEYAEISSFAYDNIISEKNNMGEETAAWMEKNIYGGKSKSEWEKKASYGDRIRASGFSKYLREVSDEKWKDEAEKLSRILYGDNKFDISTFGVRGLLSEALGRARLQAEKKETKSKTAAPIEKKAVTTKPSVEEASRAAERRYGAQNKELGVGRLHPSNVRSRSAAPGKQVALPFVPAPKTMAYEDYLAEKKKREDFDKENRPALEAKLTELGLPLDRASYSSFFGIGGFPVNDIDEIELGVNMKKSKTLSIEEMRFVIQRYELYKELDEWRKTRFPNRRGKRK